jgi:hypothetical protein
MTLNEHEGNWYILLFGIGLAEDSARIGSGLSIRSLGSPLSVFDLAAAGASGFREWATIEPFAPACHIEIESALDADITPGFDTLNRAWLVSAMLRLRGFSRHLALACSRYSWRDIAGHQTRASASFQTQVAEEGVRAAVYQPRSALPKFEGQLDYHLRMLPEEDARTDDITNLDVEWIEGNFDKLNNLCANSERFYLAFQSANDWRYASNHRIAIGRLWSGIESLFGVSSELVFRVSLLAACLLAERGTPRKQKFDEVRGLYNIRSMAVHGEKLAEHTLALATQNSYQLLRELLLLSISRGHELGKADFDEAIFG